MPCRTSRSLAGAAITVACLIPMSALTANAATLPGGPLSVSIGPLGQCQSSYSAGANNFYPAEGDIGDCGFFMGFPDAGNPAFLQGKVFGFRGNQGPALTWAYTPVDQGPVRGTGTRSDPYRLITTFKVSDAGKTERNDYALIEETAEYVIGDPQFVATFDVENVTGESVSGLSTAPSTPLRFHAIYAGDLLTGGSDFGSGLFTAGPPRAIGGASEATGTVGEFVEAPPPSPPWSNYQSGCWNTVPEAEGRCPITSSSDKGIWAAVRAAGSEAPVFNDDIDPNPVDDAAGVSWDDHLEQALKPGEHALYAIWNRAEIPGPLSVQPATQTRTVQQTATVLVTATDNTGAPYGNRRLVYSIGPTNPKSGSVLTSPTGVATISYVGTAAGPDTVQTYLDLGGSGAQTRADPASTAQVTWMAAAPAPSSRYRLVSVHVGARGTVTIVIVPFQDGTATAAVTVPTATISRGTTATKKKCKKGQVRIKGRCRRRFSVSGKVSAAGKAGLPLTLIVKASHGVRKALASGKKLRLTAKLIYKSALGGTPTTHVYQFTVRAKRKTRH